MNKQKTNQTAELVGYISPADQKVSFIIPVYQINRDLFLQEIGEDDIVKGFELAPEAIAKRLIITDSPKSVGVGDSAVFAFRFPDRSIISGTKSEIKTLLSKRRRDLSKFPFIALAVARFLGDISFGRHQIFKSAYRLERKNPNIGREWLETELHSLQPSVERIHRETFAQHMEAHQIIADINSRLETGRDVYVRLKLKRSSAGVSPKIKNLLSAFQLEKARIGSETRFLPVTQGALQNMKQLNHLLRIVDVIELPKETSILGDKEQRV